MIDDFISTPSTAVAVLRLLGSGFPQEEAWDASMYAVRAGWAQGWRASRSAWRSSQGNEPGRPGAGPAKGS